MKRIFSVVVMVVFSMALFSGCGKKHATNLYQGLNAPDWVTQGSGAFDSGDHGKIFYGVGSASGIKNSSLLRKTSENRAKNEIAGVFNIYTASLMKDYMASISNLDPNAMGEEQLVEQAIKTVTSASLSGVKVIDHWVNPNTQEFFSLASLDMEKFLESLEKMKELNGKIKAHIRKNAGRLHDELAKEEAKMPAAK